MEKDNTISPAEFNLIASQVRDDEADPEEVRDLLEYICKLVDQEEPLPPEILKYIRDSLRAHLADSKKSLDRSFGVKRKRGRPKADWEQRVHMATEILRLRLMENMNHENAVSVVGRQFSKESSVVGEAWAAHKFEAYIALRHKQPEEKTPWTEQEIQQLYKIFSKESWLIPPGKDRNKP